MHVISILLEQSQNIVIVTDCQRFRKQTYLVLTAWLLLSFLVSNAYKGVLFSLLTTPSLPQVPETLTEVVSSDLFAITASGLTTKINGKKVRVSRTKRYIDDLIAEVEAGKLVIEDADAYRELKDKVVYLNGSSVSDICL